MNTFKKFYPNVFVAQCTEQHEKGEIIVIETKYGKEIENEVHNYLGKTKDGFFLYSITRVDGFNSQERAQNKSNKLECYAGNAMKRADAFYQKSQTGKDFLSLGEPIKVGHHSERRHRKLIESNWANMGKYVSESEKAAEYERRAAYWAKLANKIDLSMPDSLEYFEEELRKAKEYHQLLKDNPEHRRHSMSLQYANKAVKDLMEKVEMAIRLWGEPEEVAQLAKEKEDAAKKKACNKKSDIIEKYNGFFAFNSEQFRTAYDNLCNEGIINQGDKVVHIGKGLYLPKQNVEAFLIEYK